MQTLGSFLQYLANFPAEEGSNFGGSEFFWTGGNRQKGWKEASEITLASGNRLPPARDVKHLPRNYATILRPLLCEDVEVLETEFSRLMTICWLLFWLKLMVSCSVGD
jgi:hypothetical protein